MQNNLVTGTGIKTLEPEWVRDEDEKLHLVAPPKRPRGRPTVGAGTGGFKRVMLAMYQEQLDIADRIHPQRSAAVRLALEFWAKHNPEKPSQT